MNTNLDKIALDLYGKIQTRFPDIKIGDEEAKVLSKKTDIPKARFFEFEYKDNGESLGTIAITLDEDDGVVMQLSGELADSQHHGAFRFIRSFRQFAKNRLLKFDVQNIGKSELDKRDYAFQAKPKEDQMEPIMESKMYGTARMSYQDLGEAKLIVKHSQPINTELAAGRTMHIEGIWVENADGERFKYPYKHLNGARALAEHLKSGGNPYDGIGQHITSLSEELAQLRKFKNYVGRNATLSEAMDDINGCVNERIESVKKEVQNLQRSTYYQQFAESFTANESQEIPEEILNDWIDRLTIRTFNEDLKTAFPYIYRLVGENIAVRELSPEDLISEVFDDDKETGTTHKGGKVEKTKHGIKHTKTDYEDGHGQPGKKSDDIQSRYKKYPVPDPEDQFESFINSIVEDEENQDGTDTLLSPNKTTQQDAIEKFNQIMSTELKGGPSGINIVDSLKGLIDDPEFLEKMKDIDPDLDARSVIQSELQDMAKDNPDLARILPQLDFQGNGEIGGAEVPPEAGTTPPAPDATAAAPAPDATAATPAPEEPAPVAEGSDEEPPFDPDPPRKNPIAKAGKHGQGYSTAKHLAHAGLIKAIHNAKKSGAGLDTTLDFGHKQMTLHDCIEECGLSPQDFGFDAGANESGVEQMLKSISGFWNKEAKNFTIGGTRAKTKIVKDFKNGEFENASEQDLQQVLHMIDKMDPSSDAHNELGHIKRLAGMHNQETDEGTEEEDFGKILDQFKQQHPQADLNKLMQTVGGDEEGGMPNMGGMMKGMKMPAMPKMPPMPQGGGNSITVNGKPATQAEFDAFTKQHNVVPGQMPGGQKLTPGQLPSLPGGMKAPQLGGNPQDMVNNMMKGMNESAELTAMLKIAGLR